MKISWDHVAACANLHCFIIFPISHHSTQLPPRFYMSAYTKCTVNCFSAFRVCVFASNGRHYKTHLLSSHRVQNNRDVFFLSRLFLFLRQQQLSQLNLNAMLLAPGLFDYPQTGSCAGFHSFHHALTSVSWLPCRILWEVILVPLLYADDFGCLSPV